MTLSHTFAQLLDEIKQDRKARGEPEGGATATAAEERRFLRRLKLGLVG